MFFLVTSPDFYMTFSAAVLSSHLPLEGSSSHHIKSGNVSASIVITNLLEAKLLDLCWIFACFSFFPLFIHLFERRGQTHAELSVLIFFPFRLAFFASNISEILIAFREAIKNKDIDRGDRSGVCRVKKKRVGSMN